MKRFKFSLESLLRYRSHLEHLAKQETAEARAEVNICMENIRICQEDIKTTLEDLNRETEKGITLDRYRIHTDYLEGSERKIEYFSEELIRLNRILAEKQKLLKQRSIEKKTIENLKEKKKTEYYIEMDKYLQKQTDDMIIVKKSREIREF